MKFDRTAAGQLRLLFDFDSDGPCGSVDACPVRTVLKDVFDAAPGERLDGLRALVSMRSPDAPRAIGRSRAGCRV